MSEARERLVAAQEGRRQRGLHPKGTDQTYEEQTRVLMTWTKADLVRSLIHEESDKLKALDQLIDARAAQVVPQPNRDTEAAWRKAIADQVRRNCTLDWDVMRKGGDGVIYAVCDWIENPPEWSAFTAPAESALSPAPLSIDREALAKVALKTYNEWASLSPLKQMSFGYPSLGELIADAVIAHLSAQPVASEELTRLYQINEQLAGQLQAAQAAISKVLDRSQEPVHPYGDQTIPKVPEIDFIRDAYGDIADDIKVILSRVDTSALAAVKAEALRSFAARIRSELKESADAGIDLGNAYLHGMRSVLQQADDRATSIEQEGAK